MNNLTIITLSSPNIADFAAARNTELAQAKTDWVLFVDSDEKVTPELEREIKSAIKSNKYAGYYLKRLDTFLERELHYGETGHAKFIRLARRTAGKWVRPVHEIWQVKGGVGELKNPLLHQPHASISAFLSKIDLYSSLEAEYRYQLGKKSSLLHIFIYPLAKFKYNYFWLQGFRDGVPGVVMAIMMSFHSYLTWTKLYLLWHKK